jgi:ribosomal protein L37AE/L43A
MKEKKEQQEEGMCIICEKKKGKHKSMVGWICSEKCRKKLELRIIDFLMQ